MAGGASSTGAVSAVSSLIAVNAVSFSTPGAGATSGSGSGGKKSSATGASAAGLGGSGRGLDPKTLVGFVARRSAPAMDPDGAAGDSDGGATAPASLGCSEPFSPEDALVPACPTESPGREILPTSLASLFGSAGLCRGVRFLLGVGLGSIGIRSDASVRDFQVARKGTSPDDASPGNGICFSLAVKRALVSGDSRPATSASASIGGTGAVSFFAARAISGARVSDTSVIGASADKTTATSSAGRAGSSTTMSSGADDSRAMGVG